VMGANYGPGSLRGHALFGLTDGRSTMRQSLLALLDSHCHIDFVVTWRGQRGASCLECRELDMQVLALVLISRVFALHLPRAQNPPNLPTATLDTNDRTTKPPKWDPSQPPRVRLRIYRNRKIEEMCIYCEVGFASWQQRPVENNSSKHASIRFPKFALIANIP